MADFDAPKLMLTGLAKFELPGHTIRLCDGGFVYYDGEKYASEDTLFGSIESIAQIEENSGDEAPGMNLVFLPATTAAAAELSNPAFQNSRVRFWQARVNEQTGEIDGEPELLRDLLLDTTTLRPGRGTRKLEMELIGAAERLFLVNDGNVLSPRFHKSVWAGETGLDNATGVTLSVAWGVAAPARGTVSGTSIPGGARTTSGSVGAAGSALREV
jgi:hypothetical protein